MNRVTVSLAISLMVLAAAPHARAHQAAITAENLNQTIASATTPADHEAIAAYYDNEAAENHKMVVYHAGMKNIFTKAPNQFHCNSLIKQYRAAAEADKALAAQHRAMASNVEASK